MAPDMSSTMIEAGTGRSLEMIFSALMLILMLSRKYVPALDEEDEVMVAVVGSGVEVMVQD